MKGVSLTAAIRTAAKAASRPGTKLVRYDGYEVSVPASWPVYDLTKDPHRCVRYDVNAVYLGTPGPDQNCPPNLVGRADTISIGPAGPATQLTPAIRKTAGDRKTPARTDQRAFTPGTIIQDADLHEVALAMPGTAPWIDATYGADPKLVEQTLATVRPVTTRPARTGDAIHPAVVRERPAVVQQHPPVIEAKNPAWPKNPAPPTGIPAAWLPPAAPKPPPPAPKPPPKTTPGPKPTGPVLADNPAPAPAPSTPTGAMAGFDTCTAPSLPTMKAWRAKYSATAIYIGGQMMACGQANLSASWVQQAEAMGWSLMPTFVGLQAPCDSFSGKVDAKHAASQGTAAANQAVADANTFGLGSGSPIYYDMEAYDHTNAGCRTAVLTFLDAWTRQLQAQGYVSGVYSSADAAIIDLQSTTTIAGHPLAEPQAIWFALWDNATSLTGAPYMTAAVWPVANRSKQYAGNSVVKVGGISLDVDLDWVASAVAHG
jgi:hypothetical protein